MSDQPNRPRSMTIEGAVELARSLAETNLSAARKVCLQVLAQLPEAAAMAQALGEIEVKAGNDLEAERCFRKAMGSPNHALGARLSLTALLVRQSRNAEALEALGAAVLPQGMPAIGQDRQWNAPLALRPQDLGLANPSFSLSGEDMVLRKMFKRKILAREPGFYVDIGCNAPVEMSNTYLFYCYGWSGLCIDAIGSLADEFRRVRPRDQFLQCLISDQRSAVRFERNLRDAGTSRILAAGETAEAGCVVEEFEPRRLDEVLSAHIGPIDLFSIDVEGAEMAVLRSNDWQRFRPTVIVMEAHGCDPARPQAAEPVAYLMERGYGVAATTPSNVYLQTGA